jgi:hypothetical protein
MSTSKNAWNEVGDRFTAVGKRLAGHYGQRADGTSTKETQHKVEEVVREIGNQLGRAFEAVDDTVRDDAARQDLKQAFNALGSAISTTVEDAATAIRAPKGDQPPRPD